MQKDPCVHSGCKAGFSQASLESFGIQIGIGNS